MLGGRCVGVRVGGGDGAGWEGFAGGGGGGWGRGWGGDVMILLLVGSLMASSRGWSFAFGCSPAAILRLLW